MSSGRGRNACLSPNPYWEEVKYYFADFVRRGGGFPPTLRTFVKTFCSKMPTDCVFFATKHLKIVFFCPKTPVFFSSKKLRSRALPPLTNKFFGNKGVVELLSYLRIYWGSSDSTELPQILLSYLRIYWATSEFTVLPQNLLCSLRILLSYLVFWKFKFECYLAPRKCTISSKSH